MIAASFQELISHIDPVVYTNLKRAVEIGKWPDGRLLTDEQRALSLQAIIAYEQQKNIPAEERTGYIDRTGFGTRPPKTDACHPHHKK